MHRSYDLVSRLLSYRDVAKPFYSSTPAGIFPSLGSLIPQASSSVSMMSQCPDPNSETHLWTLDCKFRPTIDYSKNPQDLSHVALSGSGVRSRVPQMRPPRSSKVSEINKKYI